VTIFISFFYFKSFVNCNQLKKLHLIILLIFWKIASSHWVSRSSWTEVTNILILNLILYRKVQKLIAVEKATRFTVIWQINFSPFLLYIHNRFIEYFNHNIQIHQPMFIKLKGKIKWRRYHSELSLFIW